MNGRLVLTRALRQVVVIGPDITIEVCGFMDRRGRPVNARDLQVRLAIQAPKEVVVDRQEIASRRAKGGPN